MCGFQLIARRLAGGPDAGAGLGVVTGCVRIVRQGGAHASDANCTNIGTTNFSGAQLRSADDFSHIEPHDVVCKDECACAEKCAVWREQCSHVLPRNGRATNHVHLGALKALTIATLRDLEQAHTTRKMRWCVSSSNKGEQESHARQRRTSLQSVRKRTRRERDTRDNSCTVAAHPSTHYSTRVWLNGVETQMSFGLFSKQRRSSPQPRRGVLLRSRSRRQQALEDCTPGHCPNVVIASGAVAYLHYADAIGDQREMKLMQHMRNHLRA